MTTAWLLLYVLPAVIGLLLFTHSVRLDKDVTLGEVRLILTCALLPVVNIITILFTITWLLQRSLDGKDTQVIVKKYPR